MQFLIELGLNHAAAKALARIGPPARPADAALGERLGD
jgi:hypothetical protein